MVASAPKKQQCRKKIRMKILYVLAQVKVKVGLWSTHVFCWPSSNHNQCMNGYIFCFFLSLTMHWPQVPTSLLRTETFLLACHVQIRQKIFPLSDLRHNCWSANLRRWPVLQMTLFISSVPIGLLKYLGIVQLSTYQRNIVVSRTFVKNVIVSNLDQHQYCNVICN